MDSQTIANSGPQASSHRVTHGRFWLLLGLLIAVAMVWVNFQAPSDAISFEMNGEPVEGIAAFFAAFAGLIVGSAVVGLIAVFLVALAAGISLVLVVVLSLGVLGLLLLLFPLSLPLFLVVGIVFWLICKRIPVRG
ncbi:hypothetical protein ACUHMQ_19100 [Chitinimonas sp. PSY-7]|uniref:hypothetical protein n=1 Tax=Chitinimonas sp. PSY-7 TaxID=3459088 RepID=UPI0040400512